MKEMHTAETMTSLLILACNRITIEKDVKLQVIYLSDSNTIAFSIKTNLHASLLVHMDRKHTTLQCFNIGTSKNMGQMEN